VLRERFGRAITLSSEGVDEERLLLSLLVGGSSERIEVSWQRADESGRARSPSLALREVMRIAHGDPDLERLREDDEGLVTAVPSHPTLWLEYLLQRSEMLTPDQGALLEALQVRDSTQTAALAARHPELGPGLTMLLATQAFGIVDPRYDARLDGGRQVERLSVSAIERLGRCPLQYFFRDVLRVHELDEEATAAALTSADLGSRIHELLRDLYASLFADGPVDAGRARQAKQDAIDRLRAERARMFGPAGARATRRLPALWQLVADRWFETLAAFVSRDLDRTAAEGRRPDGLEIPASSDVALDDGSSVEVHGRFDRRSRRDGAIVVSDYKTSGRLADRVVPREMLKGRFLQVPLYWLMAGDRTEVELLGVGPRFDPCDEENSVARFSGFADEAQRRGFVETLRVLVEFVRQGRFPLNDDRHCSYCAYGPACRRTHPPTRERERLYDDTRRFEALRAKTQKQPMLARPEKRHDDQA
jgi:hypothetical protein